MPPFSVSYLVLVFVRLAKYAAKNELENKINNE